MAQSTALTSTPADGTEYYDPATAELSSTKTACGKGTTKDSGTKFDLPNIIEYEGTTDASGKAIAVTFASGAVTKIEFVSVP